MNDCLHCELLEATQKWLKVHHASDQDIIDMLGNFVVKAMSERPKFLGLVVKVVILGIEFHSDHKAHLH